MNMQRFSTDSLIMKMKMTAYFRQAQNGLFMHSWKLLIHNAGKRLYLVLFFCYFLDPDLCQMSVGSIVRGCVLHEFKSLQASWDAQTGFCIKTYEYLHERILCGD